jgi:hypothetical protein
MFGSSKIVANIYKDQNSHNSCKMSATIGPALCSKEEERTRGVIL